MRYKIEDRFAEAKFPVSIGKLKLLQINNHIDFGEHKEVFRVFCQILVKRIKDEITVTEFYNLYGGLIFDIKTNKITEKNHPDAKALTHLTDFVYNEFEMKIYIIGKTVFGDEFASYFLQLIENVDHHVFTYMEL